MNNNNCCPAEYLACQGTFPWLSYDRSQDRPSSLISNQEQHINSEIEKRSFNRLINFTDAVSAIAITLQLLPLVNIKAIEGESIWQLLGNNASRVLVFCCSSLIVSFFG
ncbi:TMEM175 family protein [Synechococcus sp. A18-25c]|uniref:TMEM175 family protein n=1 Tax=Synechococcus sp. A18-25c TaxID=1866938 RepID=UPI00351C97F6